MKMNRRVKHLMVNFQNAFIGIFYLLIEGKIFRILLVCGIAVITIGFVFHVTRSEWAILLLTIGSVLGAEGLNSSVEKLADYATGEYSMMIRRVKDFAAGAVLILSIFAAIIGLIIFIPYFAAWINGFSG